MNAIVSEETFEDHECAAIWAIQSKVLQICGFHACANAIVCAKKAVELDPTVPLWHFMLGKSLARERRINSPYELPSDEEIHELETAWQMLKKPDFGVMLLMTYNALYRKCPKNKISDLKELILKTLREIKKCAANEWYVYWRCAHSCTRLSDVVPKEEIKELIDLALQYSKESGNSNEQHLYEVQAAYYKFCEKNLRKSLEFAKKAANCGEPTCAIDALSLNHRLNSDEDLLPMIDNYIHLFRNLRADTFKLAKASYLFFVKGEIEEALDLYFTIMNQNPKLYTLLKWRPLFYESKFTYNTYTALKTELEWRIKSPHSSKELLKLYQDYLKKVCELEKKSME